MVLAERGNAVKTEDVVKTESCQSFGVKVEGFGVWDEVDESSVEGGSYIVDAALGDIC